jgi:hypothetical protein
LRREGRTISAEPVVLPRAFLLHADHGCQPAPGLPRALFAFEGDSDQDPGEIRAAGMFKHVLEMCINLTTGLPSKNGQSRTPGPVGASSDVSGMLDRPVIPDQVGDWRRATTNGNG